MKSAIRLTGTTLGVYAGILGIEHGAFEVSQGSIRPDGILINAIGSPCQPDAVWHACYPALTLIPDVFTTGIFAIGVGLVMIVWASMFFHREFGGLVLLLLSFLLLMVGGGFVSAYVGIVAGVAGSRFRISSAWLHYRPGKAAGLLSTFWLWTLIIMGVWLPGSWILGHFFAQTMLALSFVLFLMFDIGLPILAVISGFAHDLMRA